MNELRIFLQLQTWRLFKLTLHSTKVADLSIARSGNIRVGSLVSALARTMSKIGGRELLKSS